MKKNILTILLSLVSLALPAQAFVQRGIVMNESGEPLIGVTVIEKGTTNGVITDIDGEFRLTVSEGAVLLVSYIGYNNKEYVASKAIPYLKIVLEEDAYILEESLVVGYGATSKREMAASVGRIYADAVLDESKVGLMTATEINDFSKWMIWDSIVAKNFIPYQETWEIKPKDRYVAQLTTENGLPVVDAVAVLMDARSEIVWEARTDNTGRAELWANLYGTGNDFRKPYSIEFIYGENDTVVPAIPFEEGINSVSMQVNCNGRNEVDIMMVVDATGSMGDEIVFLQNELHDILKKIQKNQRNLDIKVGSVFYRDHGDEYLTRKTPLDADIKKTINFIQAQRAEGGGDYPEALDIALYESIEQENWREEALTRIAFIVLDAPAHEKPENIEMIHRQLKIAARKGIRIIPLICSDMREDGEYLMRAMALATNGTSVFLTDDSGIGNSHIKPKTDSYDVESLNDLLIRLVMQYTVMPDCESDKWIKEMKKKQETDNYIPNPYDESPEEDVDKLAAKNVMKVYPNPCRDILKVELKKAAEEIYVVDIGGKSLLKFNPAGSETLEIDMSGYSSGVYFVKAFYKGKWFTEKIIVRR